MDLTDRRAHFEFGANWNDYARTINSDRINAAIAGMSKLLPAGLTGKKFIDVGCGSGVHSLAAMKLGAASVHAIDIDENSVATTKEVLTRFSGNPNWAANILSVFDIPAEMFGQYDVVYSWGVLHHTGNMWKAIERASKLTAPGGTFVLAIYGKTFFDRAWKIEKRIYSRSSTGLQWIIRQPYKAAVLTAQALKRLGKKSRDGANSALRGMNFENDVHDWLGGYPYETATPKELKARVEAMGFKQLEAFPVRIPLCGLFSSGCHELVFERE